MTKSRDSDNLQLQGKPQFRANKIKLFTFLRRITILPKKRHLSFIKLTWDDDTHDNFGK